MTSTTWRSALANWPDAKALQKHDRIIIVAGVPFGTPGATNMIRIAVLDGNSK